MFNKESSSWGGFGQTPLDAYCKYYNETPLCNLFVLIESLNK
jgi:hypothetical protein